jgi:hypothetical protein
VENGSEDTSKTSPPRAFTQGVGTVFQFTGVTLFLVFFFVCCFSSLISKESATHTNLTTIGWGDYSAQRAISICLIVGIFLGLALAGIGLGLQAQRRHSPTFAVVLCTFGSLFWLAHAMFFAQSMQLLLVTFLSVLLMLVFIGLLMLSIAGLREMRHDPPPRGFELLPADYKVPYSHMHQDPPEVRLAKELEQRREKLAVQQKELEMLEEKLNKKLKQKDE